MAGSEGGADEGTQLLLLSGRAWASPGYLLSPSLANTVGEGRVTAPAQVYYTYILVHYCTSIQLYNSTTIRVGLARLRPPAPAGENRWGGLRHSAGAGRLTYSLLYYYITLLQYY